MERVLSKTTPLSFLLITGLNPNSTILDFSQDLADYTTPTSATATSESGGGSFTEVDSFTTTANDNGTLGNGTVTRRGQRFTTGYGFFGTEISRFTFFLRNIGSPTGTLTAVIRDLATDSIVATYGSIDVTTLTGTLQEINFTATSAQRILALNDILSVEYDGGDVGNHVQIGRVGGNPKANTNAAAFTPPNWAEGTEDSNYRIFTGGLGNTASLAIDGDTATFWESDAGINESITLDMGSFVNMYGLSYFIEKADFTETQIQIIRPETTQGADIELDSEATPTTGVGGTSGQISIAVGASNSNRIIVLGVSQRTVSNQASAVTSDLNGAFTPAIQIS